MSLYIWGAWSLVSRRVGREMPFLETSMVPLRLGVPSWSRCGQDRREKEAEGQVPRRADFLSPFIHQGKESLSSKGSSLPHLWDFQG